MADDRHSDPLTDQGETSGIDRRKALGIGVGVAGAAWVAPSIISATAAAAATGDPEPCTPCGSLRVDVTGCFTSPGNLTLTVTPSSGSPQVIIFPGSTPTPTSFEFFSLCAGPATVTLTSGGQDICSSPQQANIVCGGQPNVVLLTCPC